MRTRVRVALQVWSNSSCTCRNVLDSSIPWHCDWAGFRAVSRNGVRKALANVIWSWFAHGAAPLLLGAGCGPINPCSLLCASSGWAHCIGAGKVWRAFLQSSGKEWHSLFAFLWQEAYNGLWAFFTFFQLRAIDSSQQGTPEEMALCPSTASAVLSLPYSVQSQTLPCLSFSRCECSSQAHLPSRQCWGMLPLRVAHRSWSHSM